MRKAFSLLSLAVLTVGLLGSCSKINERLDNLEKDVNGLKNEKIASIESQIAGITSSIADLGTIRSDISSLKQSAENHSIDIFNLEEADRALKDRIDNLEDYLDDVLPNYAEKEWVEATFSTLEQYDSTCTAIAEINVKIGELDARTARDIQACADSMKTWVNEQLDAYYTAAGMDAKLTKMKSAVDSARAAGKIPAGSTLTVAVNVKKDKSDYTTEFVPVYVAGPALPEGALAGEFSVSATKKVHFSKGNLYAKNEGTTESPDWKWHFYDKQYNFLAANMDVSGSTNSPQRSVGANETEIDLFTWGYNATYSVKPTGKDFVGGHGTEGGKHLNPSTGGDDWGVAYCESNSIDVGTWRTLSTAEWQYLFNTRTMANGGARSENLTSSGITVEGVTFKGVVLFPDDFTDQADWRTKYTTWKALNDAGLVFLPAAGDREGSDVYDVGDFGVYWSSTAYDADNAYDVYFNSSDVVTDDYDGRRNGYSVRLITASK